MAENSKPLIAILGGTGDLGSGLAKCWVAAGYSVVIGSRSAEKAQAFAAELGGNAIGKGNVEAARAADVIVLAVPFASHESRCVK